MDEKLYRVNFEEIVKEMKNIVDDYEKLPQDALKKTEIELLDIEHKEQITTDIIETYKQKMETYQNLQYEEAGDIFNKAKLEYENAKRNLSSIMSKKKDKQVEVNKIKNMMQDNVIKNAKDQNALKDKKIKKRIASITEEKEEFRKNVDKNINLELHQIEEKEIKFKLARNNANNNAEIVTAEEKMVLDNFANEKQSIMEKYNNNIKKYMDKANDEIDKLERIKQENHRALLEFIKVVKDPEKIKLLFNGYETEKIEPEKSKKAEVVENHTKQKNNDAKENASDEEKLKDPNFVELDEFLDKKEDNGKQENNKEKVSAGKKEEELKLVDFNEFLNGREDKKNKDIEDDKDSKIIAIAGKNIDGFIKYQYVNEETEKTKETERYDKKSYKEYYNEYRTMGFKNGTVEFDIDTLKNVDPLLLKYLENTKPDLALQVAKKISNHEDLSEFKDLIKYDMTGADKLTRKEKKICRKIAKIARRNGLEVKNIEATKGFWGKLLDKILVRDAGDEFLVAAKETKQLEAGESEKEKTTNAFKEQIKQQVRQQIKEENSIDTFETEEISTEVRENIEKAMENKKENLKELNKDEDEIEK